MKAKNPKKTNSPLEKSKNNASKPVENSRKKSQKTAKIFILLGVLFGVGGVVLAIIPFFIPKTTETETIFPEIPTKKSDGIYSNLTGLALTSETEKTAPAYCVQTPNGMDGARPQVGLNEAGVVFEAIAEAGITRFAAIYQNPTSAVIGPIRSLRMYYLEWDTPFDCTIVHAGGAPDALQAVSSGKYRDLTENYAYMYRGTAGVRRWNNLFTTSQYLAQFNADKGYTSSNINGFTRMTPEESLKSRVDALADEKLVIYEPSTGKTAGVTVKVPTVAVKFGGIASFNVRYNYDLESNTYLRSYENGVVHDVYSCPAENLGEKNPEAVCTLKQLAPAVVAVIMVPEKKASDNYHEDITVLGSGNAYVFQNGTAVKGTWKKATDADQIKFYTSDGSEIALAPGQTFVEAVPTYGSVEY